MEAFPFFVVQKILDFSASIRHHWSLCKNIWRFTDKILIFSNMNIISDVTHYLEYHEGCTSVQDVALVVRKQAIILRFIVIKDQAWRTTVSMKWTKPKCSRICSWPHNVTETEWCLDQAWHAQRAVITHTRTHLVWCPATMCCDHCHAFWYHIAGAWKNSLLMPSLAQN